MVNVEVAYAKPEQQVIVTVAMEEGATVEAAIKASGLLELFPEIVLSELKAGIFGVACKLDQPVREADRIEIYRALVHDPKEARRQRALKGF
ncbi:RnfH family protein [Methylobacter sp.]|uniref:RnfH family protein n=1 Tax=Methylobacter sp. TaxID=2051955 RepID=UPI002FDCBE82